MKNIQISRNKGFDAYLSLSTTKMRKEDLEMDKIKISDAMVLTSAQIRTYKAAFHRSRDESANNDNNDVDGGDGVDARPWERVFPFLRRRKRFVIICFHF